MNESRDIFNYDHPNAACHSPSRSLLASVHGWRRRRGTSATRPAVWRPTAAWRRDVRRRPTNSVRRRSPTVWYWYVVPVDLESAKDTAPYRGSSHRTPRWQCSPLWSSVDRLQGAGTGLTHPLSPLKAHSSTLSRTTKWRWWWLGAWRAFNVVGAAICMCKRVCTSHLFSYNYWY